VRKGVIMGIASLILGVVGLSGWALCAIHEALAVVPITSAILALVFGIVGRRQAKSNGTSGGMATAGLILGIAILVISSLVILFLGVKGPEAPPVPYESQTAIDL
jgi:hypothetical protein